MFYSSFYVGHVPCFLFECYSFQKKICLRQLSRNDLQTLWVKMNETLFWLAELQTEMGLVKMQLGQFTCMHSCHSLQFIFTKILHAKEKFERGYGTYAFSFMMQGQVLHNGLHRVVQCSKHSKGVIDKVLLSFITISSAWPMVIDQNRSEDSIHSILLSDCLYKLSFKICHLFAKFGT